MDSSLERFKQTGSTNIKTNINIFGHCKSHGKTNNSPLKQDNDSLNLFTYNHIDEWYFSGWMELKIWED